MNLIENLTCKYCKKIYSEPVFLNCCGKHICKADMDDFLSKSLIFPCPICNTELKNETFQINQTLQVLIDEAELHKIKIDQDYLSTLDNFKEKIANLELLHKDPLNIIYEKISELKMYVDFDRENAKAEIDRLADDMMTKLNSWASELEAESKSKQFLDYYDKLVANAKNNLNEYEKCLKSMSFTDEDRKNKKNSITHAIKILEMEINDYKFKLFKHKSIMYEPMKADVSSIFGKLIAIVSGLFIA